MAQSNRPVVGSIFERKTTSSAPKPPNAFVAPATRKTGFPAVQHRSKSAFARGREDLRSSSGSLARLAEPPAVKPATVPRASVGMAAVERGNWRKQVESENEKRVAAMTEEEREQEKREIEERFGADIGDILLRARRRREAAEQQESVAAEEAGSEGVSEHLNPIVHDFAVDVDPESISRVSPPPLRVDTQSPPPSPPPILSSASTRPSSRTGRMLRFADLKPQDIHVYESAPPSPRRKPLALPPPSDDDHAVSLGQWKAKMPSFAIRDLPPSPPDVHMTSPQNPEQHNPISETEDAPMSPGEPEAAVAKATEPAASQDPEEGTPEYIRRRFFPNAPAGDPNLEWIESLPPPDPTLSASLRFDLQGNPIPASVSSTLPTHLGLHHHAEGTRAGYTLDDIFLLSRSSVPAQRATMLSVLAKIVRRLGQMLRGVTGVEQGLEELRGRELELRKRILAAGVEALGEKGSVGAMAVTVMWECIVGWDEEVAAIDGVELQDEQPTGLSSESDEEKRKAAVDAASALPFDFLLPQISATFGATALPHESLLKLLSVVHRLAKHTNAIATAITNTPSMIASILRTFVLTPIPHPEDTPDPTPLAIQVLTTLALSSRENATTLVDPADSLLRFITSLPPSSPYPLPLATSLLTTTLRFYAALASYGLYSHIATTASEPLSNLSSYILSPACNSRPLIAAYAQLLEAWIVCAVDPHQTTPEHEILWSQVEAWGWGDDLLSLRTQLSSDAHDAAAWAAIWNALAAWLEGAQVNAVRAGESERARVVAAIKGGFESGTEKEVLAEAMGGLKRALDGLASGDVHKVQKWRALDPHAQVVTGAMRLWLTCLPTATVESPTEPPFQLPFSLLATLSGDIVLHRLWSSIYAEGSPVYLHAFCRPLTALLATYVRFSRQIPATTDDLWLAQACSVLIRLIPGDEDAARMMITQVLELINKPFLSSRGWYVSDSIWERGGLQIIGPFLKFSLRPDKDVYVGPAWPTPRSIKHSVTQRLPPAWAVRRRIHGSGLPLARDWTLLPLDHLLRSGTSPIWHMLPDNWDSSETEIVRAALLLARSSREALRINGLPNFAMRRAEAVFGCMKVFMLEHGQVQGAPSESSAGPSINSNEVFRDTIVNGLMEDLLAPYTLEASPTGLSASAPPDDNDDEDNLEHAAARFLGADTPFFQFYTDFVALYDAVSFAHPLFAALLLPPTAQRYAGDYRNLLYGETPHVLATVRTPVARALGARVGAWLWPVEPDARVVGAYLGVLLGRRGRGHVEGFVRLVIVHHVAASIWPDLRAAREAGAEERARKLLEAVVGQGRLEDVREVVLYWQRREGTAVLPPACFGLGEETKGARRAWLESWAPAELKERVVGLLV
ncbi:hypothetical protein DENSPDRAFT_865553 [Dentipellis sp. KUC8613]|nr:hypothetical protein DENSPDRAFT_865553 [Dentipellis sp. KUC8613]